MFYRIHKNTSLRDPFPEEMSLFERSIQALSNVSSKMALIRYLSIKNKQKNILYTPSEMKQNFNKIDGVRSTLLHKRYDSFSRKRLAHCTNIYFILFVRAEYADTGSSIAHFSTRIIA